MVYDLFWSLYVQFHVTYDKFLLLPKLLKEVEVGANRQLNYEHQEILQGYVEL